MAKEYAIGVRFAVHDNISQSLSRIGLAGGAFEKALGPSLRKAQERLNAIGAAAGRAAVTLMGLGVAAVSAGVASATRNYIAFDDAITAAGAKFKDLDVTSADHKQHLLALQEAALEVAGATRFTATDTAGALDKMAMAGLTASQSMAMLRGTASLASATGKDLTSAVDMVTDSLSAFNMTKDEFGKPLDDAALAASLQHMSDVVAKTTNMANTDMDMWFESVKMGAPTFSALGGKIEDFSAMVGVLANAGIKGGEAGTAIRNMMLRLSAPTDKAEGIMKGLGVSVYDAAGNMLPILDILKQFETAFGGDSMMMVKEYNKALRKAKGDTSKVNMNDYIVDMDMSRKIQSLNTIFGQRVVGDFLVLLGEGSEGIAEFSQTLQNSAGAAANMANAMDQSLKGRIEILKSAVDTLGIRFIQAFEADGAAVVGKLTKVVGRFTTDVLPKLVDAIKGVLPTVMNIFQKVIDSMPQLFDAIKAALPILKVIGGALGVVFGVVWALKKPLMVAAALWGAWQVAMMVLVPALHIAAAAVTAVNVVMGIGRGVMIAYKAAQVGTTVAIRGTTVAAKAAAVGMKLFAAAQWIAHAATTAFTTAMGFLNAVFVASPIGWIVLAIVAALAALVAIVVVCVKHWDELTAAFTNAGGGIAGIVAAVDTLFQKFSEMSGIGGALLNVLILPFKELWTVIRGIIDIFSAFINGGFWSGLKQIGVAIIDYIAAPIEAILRLVSFIPGVDWLSGKIMGGFDSMKSKLLTGNSISEQVSAAGSVAMQPPTQTAASASSYSREETESVSRVEIGLEKGVTASTSALAPGVTLDRGQR